MDRFIITATTTIGEILAAMDAGTDLYYDDNDTLMKLNGDIGNGVLTVHFEPVEVE